jgi:hypothetical protein
MSLKDYVTPSLAKYFQPHQWKTATGMTNRMDGLVHTLSMHMYTADYLTVRLDSSQKRHLTPPCDSI